jgi:hypothetical protein
LLVVAFVPIVFFRKRSRLGVQTKRASQGVSFCDIVFSPEDFSERVDKWFSRRVHAEEYKQREEDARESLVKKGFGFARGEF